jgi:hypothetical protein
VPDEDKKKQNNEEYKFTFSPKNKKKKQWKSRMSLTTRFLITRPNIDGPPDFLSRIFFYFYFACTKKPTSFFYFFFSRLFICFFYYVIPHEWQPKRTKCELLNLESQSLWRSSSRLQIKEKCCFLVFVSGGEGVVAAVWSVYKNTDHMVTQQRLSSLSRPSDFSLREWMWLYTTVYSLRRSKTTATDNNSANPLPPPSKPNDNNNNKKKKKKIKNKTHGGKVPRIWFSYFFTMSNP